MGSGANTGLTVGRVLDVGPHDAEVRVTRS
jgi:hypothetical protein